MASSYGNEIITLQLGHYSNFVGTHWWNCQEASFEYGSTTSSEINHDVLFREGQTQNGEVTFTPRMLLVDLKGSLGTLPEGGGLYDPPQPPDITQPLWPTDKITIQTTSSTSEKNEFLQDLDEAMSVESTLPNGLKQEGLAVPKPYHLDNSVIVWSDYLRTHLHPRNITLINQYQHNCETSPFDNFKLGEEVWKIPSFNEEFTDRIRCYMEECNNLQGFHMLLDAYNGFSGLACSNLEYLRDEYSTKSILAFPCLPAMFPDSTRAQDSVRVINLALGMSTLSEHVSLFAPLSCAGQGWRETGNHLKIPYLDYKFDQSYHTSSILASALETLSLPYRLRSRQSTLSELTNSLRVVGRTAVAASVCLPFPIRRSSTLLQTLEEWEGPLFHNITPNCTLGYDTSWIQMLSLRGVPEGRLKSETRTVVDRSNPAYSCRNITEMLQVYLSFCESTGRTIISTADSPLSTSSPFPHIFSDNIMADGTLDTRLRGKDTEVSSVPVLAGLHSSQNVGNMLSSLHTEAIRINIRTLHQFTSSGLESTEFSESLEQLLCLSECYSDQINY